MATWLRILLIIVSAAVIVAMIAVWVFVDLGTASAVASVVGAIAGVVTLISSAMADSGSSVEVDHTGAVNAPGRAISGVRVGRRFRGSIKAKNTGPATSTGDSAVSGVEVVE